ncbi:hypothetical protein X949_5878 [Burkholderia pseudomallei MSHR5609]|nr:hypothetical protein X949_5878 [Burkholderia pseudomallei MSHR5609]
MARRRANVARGSRQPGESGRRSERGLRRAARESRRNRDWRQPRIRAAKRQPESHANRNIVRATMSGPSAGIAPRPAPRAFAAPPDRPKTCLP